MSWLKNTGAGLALSLFAAAALAQTDSEVSSQSSEPPGVLQKAVDAGQLTIERQFSTDVPGLTGYVIKQQGQHQIVYGENGYLIMGELISQNGDNLSANYSDRYIPKPDVSQVVDQLKSSDDLIQQGPDNAPVLYVFADPNCIYCHRFYDRVEPLVQAGKLQVQWVMVGFLKESSMGRAAAILSADDPVAALVENENGFSEDSEDGGIEPLDSTPDQLKKTIDAHYKQMAAAGGSGTPTVLYKKDDQWAAKVGMPPSSWFQSYIDRHQ